MKADLSVKSNTTINRIQRLGLIENPFLPYPDGRYFYPCTEHQTLYQEVLRIVTEKRKRCIALIRGDAGTGKSMLSRRLVGVAFPSSDINSVGVLLQGDIHTPTALVRKVNAELSLPTERTYEGRMEILRKEVENFHDQSRSLFLAVDASLKTDAVTALVEMAGWQKNGQNLVQLAVFSSDNVFSLEEKRPALTQFVGFRNTLGPLTWRSATDLVEARVRMAGRIAPLFTDDALDTLIEVARGIPGNIMKVADQALKLMFNGNEEIITESTILLATE